MQLSVHIPPVPYHRIHNPQPSAETQVDTAEAGSAAFIAGAEDDLAMLTRLARIGMEAVEAQNDYLKARLAKAASGEAPLRPGEDPAAPLDKLTQSVRRTLALKRKIAEDLEKHHRGVGAESAARRARRTDDRRRSVGNAIEDALTEAFTVVYGDGDAETDEGDALCAEMLTEKENLLGDLDLSGAWLDRPVGETVAMLCEALGLPADTCIRKDGVWLINRAPSAWERFVETRAGEAKAPPATAVCSP